MMAAGRPTDYRPEFVEQAKKLCALGAKDVELADFFGVAVSTLARWKATIPEFSDAVKNAKEAADARVERSLYERATGYTFPSVKIFQYEGRPVEVPYMEHVPPDTTAMIFWLKNRQPAKWRDKIQQEHSGPDGAPLVPVINLNGRPEPTFASTPVGRVRDDGD